MANQQAWQSGWDTAAGLLAERRARKEMLSDEERQAKVSDLYAKRQQLAHAMPSLSGDHRERAMEALTDIEGAIEQVYHPDHAPGALQKDWGWLKQLITRNKPIVPASIEIPASTTADTTIKPEAQAVTLPATSSYQSAQLRKPLEPGTPEATIKLPGSEVTIPGTSQPRVVPAAASMTPYQRKLQAQRDRARKAAALDVEAGTSPEEEAEADSRKNLAFIQQSVKAYAAANPNASSEQKAEFFNDLITKTFGLAQTKPAWKEYVSPDGSKQWFDASRPDLIPSGWTATGAESADTRTRADFEAYRKLRPEYRGTFEQWKTEQSQLGRLAVPTNRDDRYIAIEQKRALGQPLTADDQAYAAAYDLYINKRIIAPAVARAAAQGADRYVQVLDPQNPERVTFMRAGDAAAQGAGSPASIGFQIDKAVTKYMVAGPGATNLSYFNTSIDHLRLLSETADALNNGDVQRLNQFANAFAAETGDPAPTNFETVKSAVAGEISKTFKGTGATDTEIAQINQEINSSESPDQLHGAINYYLRLMDGKLNALRLQFTQGRQGQPAFTPASGAGSGPASTGGSATGTKGARSVANVMQYFRDHPQQAQANFGTAAPTEEQVVGYIQGKGYSAVRP